MLLSLSSRLREVANFSGGDGKIDNCFSVTTLFIDASDVCLIKLERKKSSLSKGMAQATSTFGVDVRCKQSLVNVARFDFLLEAKNNQDNGHDHGNNQHAPERSDKWVEVENLRNKLEEPCGDGETEAADRGKNAHDEGITLFLRDVGKQIRRPCHDDRATRTDKKRSKAHCREGTSEDEQYRAGRHHGKSERNGKCLEERLNAID